MAGPRFSSKFDGLDAFIAKLSARPAQINQALRAALFIEGQELLTDAKLLTPVDEGNLRASGTVTLPTAEGDIIVEVGFGGPAGSGNQGESNDDDVGYAVYVHEDLTAFHPVGQAKYLETPFRARRRGQAERIANRAKRRLSR